MLARSATRRDLVVAAAAAVDLHLAGVRLVAVRAGGHVRHVGEAARILLAVVLVSHLRLGAVADGAGREVVHVHETELGIGRVERQAGDRLVEARGRLAALVAGHAQVGVVVAGVDADPLAKFTLATLCRS